MYESNDSKAKKKSSIVPILALVGLVLLGGLAFLLLSGGGDEVTSAPMDDTPAETGTDATTADGTSDPTTGDSAAFDIGTTEGIKFKANTTEFAAIGNVSPETKATLDTVIGLTFVDVQETPWSPTVTNGLAVDESLETPANLQAIAGLVSNLSGPIRNPELEIVGPKLTISGETSSEESLQLINGIIEAGGWTEVENNLTANTNPLAEIQVVNLDGTTTVTGAFGDQELVDLVIDSAPVLFGEPVDTSGVVLDETRFHGLSWRRYPTFIAGMAAFTNWEAGSVNGEPYAIIDEGLNFPSGSAVLDQASATRIQGILPIMLSGTNETQIVGHTDSDGDDAANLTLSQERAEAVVAALIAGAEAAVGPDAAAALEARLIPVGKGETEPLATNDTDEGKAANRRVEVRIDNNNVG